MTTILNGLTFSPCVARPMGIKCMLMRCRFFKQCLSVVVVAAAAAVVLFIFGGSGFCCCGGDVFVWGWGWGWGSQLFVGCHYNRLVECVVK